MHAHGRTVAQCIGVFHTLSSVRTYVRTYRSQADACMHAYSLVGCPLLPLQPHKILATGSSRGQHATLTMYVRSLHYLNITQFACVHTQNWESRMWTGLQGASSSDVAHSCQCCREGSGYLCSVFASVSCLLRPPVGDNAQLQGVGGRGDLV